MNGRRRFLTASVISVQNSNFVYPSCQNCFSRLRLDLGRYSCLKCGCSGDAREASYRYRLSLEVANTREVFLVTVFGSCLEAFFGVPAKSLQRYIEDLNPEAGEASRAASPGVVIQAVETCFVGKKFIFGVKDSEKQDGAGCLPNDSRVNRCPRALTACQMFVPNPGLVGCTVLSYLHQHQCSSHSMLGPGGARSPGGLFTALDQPNSELSGLLGSGEWDEGHTNCLPNLWHQSFGLTSSSLSGGAAADPTALGSSRTACDEQKWDDSPVSLPHRQPSIDNSQDDNLTVNERNVRGDDKLHLCSTWHDSSFITKDAPSHFSERDGCRLSQSPLEKGKKDSPSKISVQRSCGLEKSPDLLQSYSFRPLISSAGLSGDGGSSQGDPWFWDELPSSESLDAFIARIENSKAVVLPTETRAQGHFPSRRGRESHAGANQSPLQLDAASATDQPHEKPQEVAEKEGASKELVLSCHQPSWISLSGKEYQQGSHFSYSSTQVKDEWGHLSSQHRILFPQLSPVEIKPSGSKGSHLSSKEGGDQEAAGCENHHSFSSLQTASNCSQSPAHLNGKCEGNVTSWRKKLSSLCELEQTSDLINVQEQGSTLAAHEKPDKVCKRQPSQEVHKNTCKGGEISSVLQDSSVCPQAGYNASADLFDASTAGAEVVIGMSSMAQAFPAQEGALTAKSTASGRKPSEMEASWDTSQCRLSFLDLFAASDPKASTPVPGSAAKLQHSPLGTQDFVPSSQSTPRVRPSLQARLPRGKESILSELPLNRLPWIGAKWKRSRPAFKGPLVKQLVSKFLHSRRSSNVSYAATDSSMTPGLIIHGSPGQEPSENDGEEWIPPSEKKWRQPLPFQNQKISGSRKSRSWETMEKSPLSEKQRWMIPRGTIGLARTEFTPKSQQPTEAPVNEVVADPEQVTVASPGSCPFSDSRRSKLSFTPRSTPNTVNWSPELFGDSSQLSTPEATL